MLAEYQSHVMCLATRLGRLVTLRWICHHRERSSLQRVALQTTASQIGTWTARGGNVACLAVVAQKRGRRGMMMARFVASATQYGHFGMFALRPRAGLLLGTNGRASRRPHPGIWTVYNILRSRVVRGMIILVPMRRCGLAHYIVCGVRTSKKCEWNETTCQEATYLGRRDC
jgi:hypothetical protein